MSLHATHTKRGASRFVLYAEFESFLRGLKLRTSRDFFQWSRTAHKLRPPDIPSRPDLVYRGRGWVSWGHAFGVQRRIVAGSTDAAGFRALSPARKASRFLNFERGRAWLESRVSEENGTRFEFQRLGRRSPTNLLFRRTDDEDADHWAGLQVKSCQKRLYRKDGVPRYGFRLVRCTEENAGFVGVCPADGLVAILAPSEVEMKRPHSLSMVLEEMRSISSEPDFLSKGLQRLWDVLPRRKLSEWCDPSQTTCLPDSNIRKHHNLTIQAAAMLYIPAGVHPVAHHDMLGQCNVILGGVRCVQKAAGQNDMQPNRIARLVHPATGPGGVRWNVRYSASDNTDLYIFFVQDQGTLVGLFVLPKSYLISVGCLAGEGAQGGRTCICLYPPQRRTQKRYDAFAKEQRQYYLNLEGEVARKEAVKRFRSLIEEAKAARTEAAISKNVCSAEADRDMVAQLRCGQGAPEEARAT